MEPHHSPQFYRHHAVEMKRQAARAETAYLKGCYLSIAEEWDHMSEETECPAPRQSGEVIRFAKPS